MAGFNRVIIVGNLTRDPEYKQLTSGQPLCKLSIATNRQFRNKQTGNMVQEVCYVDVDVWGPQAESCRQYLKKGRPVLVEGRLKLDSWEDPNGQSRSKLFIVADRVVFLSSGPAENIDDAAVQEEGARVEPQRVEPQNAMEKELLDQLEQVKTRVQAEKVKGAVSGKPARSKKAVAAEQAEEVAPAAASGEVALQDEPPFQDDLPF